MMTDKEKAEENYIKYRDKNCEITRNIYNHLHKDWRKSGVDRHEAYIDGYLDGLTEGRKEKWHDLRKNPNDLPKEIEICSNPVYVISPHGSSDLAQYDYKHKLWCYKHSNKHILYEVIAWCELPSF